MYAEMWDGGDPITLVRGVRVRLTEMTPADKVISVISGGPSGVSVRRFLVYEGRLTRLTTADSGISLISQASATKQPPNLTEVSGDQLIQLTPANSGISVISRASITECPPQIYVRYPGRLRLASISHGLKI